MNLNPFISIIIPVYNTENYLSKCLDSIILHNINHIEIILVDDGSNDNSPSICEQYKNQYDYIKVIHINNSGPATAKNKGLEIATGEYIWFIDSDDEIIKDSIKAIYENTKKSVPDILCFSYIQVDNNGYKSHTDFTHKELMLDNEKAINWFLSKKNIYSQCWNKIYKKSEIDKYHIKFIDGIKTEEDFLFNLECFVNFKIIKYIDAPFYIYTYRETSLSREYYKTNIKEFMSNMTERLKHTERIVTDRFPKLKNVCIIHSLKYYNMMIGRTKYCTYNECKPYYINAIKYINKHPFILFNNKSFLGLSTIGIVLLFILPKHLYFAYRKTRV